MRHYAVLTTIGEDKPGLVDAVSKFILDCECNIEDSRMAVLGGDFAMLILVSGSAASMEKLLKTSARAGEKLQLSIQPRLTRPPAKAVRKETLPYELEAFSLDHPGIVQHVANYLAGRQINIRLLDTTLTLAPVTGVPLFSLHAIVDLPAGENLMEVRRGLQALGERENIDIDLKPAQV
jgi:glycine cleavage system transcriptional repressor